MRERYNEYNPPISKDLREIYETALGGELRWLAGGGNKSSNTPESDLDHVRSMFGMHDEVSWKYPALFQSVDSDDTAPMIYLHDAGEILAHDTPHFIENYEQVRARRKKREAAAFRLLTRKYIDDVELKSYTRELFSRFEALNPDDVVAQYVRILDHLQAVRFGSVNVFSAKKFKTKPERQQQTNHIFSLLINPAMNLSRNLQADARVELGNFVDKEFLYLKRNGYRNNEVNPYRKLLLEGIMSPFVQD